jgi:hypothetical protein
MRRRPYALDVTSGRSSRWRDSASAPLWCPMARAACVGRGRAQITWAWGHRRQRRVSRLVSISVPRGILSFAATWPQPSHASAMLRALQLFLGLQSTSSAIREPFPSHPSLSRAWPLRTRMALDPFAHLASRAVFVGATSNTTQRILTSPASLQQLSWRAHKPKASARV